MWQLLRNARLYAPEPRQASDVLLVGKTIAALGTGLQFPPGVEGDLVDLKGMYLVPGFIDAHVHICGGGGEAGPSSQTPEIQLSQLTRNGITTVVGCLGTDTISHSMERLLMKARALAEEGISTYIYSGAYFAASTLFPTLRQDLAFIDKVIGAGEIAISDHRSAQLQLHELERLSAEARVGGMLGGKAGIVHLHLGSGRRGLELVWKLIDHTEIPLTQFVPTHINRTSALLADGIRFLQAGGYIDLTAGCDDFPADLQVPAVLHKLWEQGMLNNHVTVSSDGNGSMPQYNEQGILVRMGVGSAAVLWRDIREAVVEYQVPLEYALGTITCNPAHVLQLSHKGMIKPGYDADLVALDEDYEIRHVWALGRRMVKDRQPLVFGTYEIR